MINIQAEGLRYVYLAKGEDLNSIASSKLTVVEYPMIYDNWEKIQADGLGDIRLVLFQYFFQPDVNHLRFLHWDDEVNLDWLDNRVHDNSYSDKDFESSLISQFGRTKCFKCNWEGFTLTYSTADAYLGRGTLESKKLQERSKRKSFKDCPNCGAGLTQFVVRIFNF